MEYEIEGRLYGQEKNVAFIYIVTPPETSMHALLNKVVVSVPFHRHHSLYHMNMYLARW